MAGSAHSHYDTLGVRRGASVEEVRRAYLDRARELHPDRYGDAGAAERAAVEHQMRQVNEAWRILGNTGRRFKYDSELDGVRVMVDDDRFATRHDGTMPEEFEPIDPMARLVRALPWMLLVAVLGGIFIFTAYAVTDGGDGDLPGNGRCVTVAADTTVTPSDCAVPGVRRVVVEVGSAQVCPPGTERLQPINGTHALCLEP